MPEQLPTTGKYTHKAYRCKECGHEREVGTNHWGDIYSDCPACSWKRPGQVTVSECLEDMPPGFAKPAPWRIVRLGDIAEIRRGIPLPRK